MKPETFNQFGYNRQPFLYPFKRDPILSQKYQDHLNNELGLPDRLIPAYSSTLKCTHNYGFSDDDSKLRLISKTVTIYDLESEKKLDISLFGRPSDGPCQCVDQPDLNNLMLWNIGGSRLLTYKFLAHCVHGFNNDIAFNAAYNTRKDKLSAFGVHTDLTYVQFERALTGFQQQQTFFNEDWICDGQDGCGETPELLLCDAKAAGPQLDKVAHLSELEPHSQDSNVLDAGSTFKDRVFLFKKKERSLTKQLVDGDISPQDFVSSRNITTESGILIKNMVSRLISDFGEVPSAYKYWLEDLLKPTSVSGYIQVTSREGLEIIEAVANKTLDLRSLNEIERTKELQKQAPPLFQALSEILKVENDSQWLPQDVLDILKQLLKIRIEVIEQAPQRQASDYIK